MVIRMNRWGRQPQDRDYLSEIMVEARAAHRRQQRRVPWKFYNSTPWFQDISSYQIVCADMNYRSPRTPSFRRRFFVIAARHKASRNVLWALTTTFLGRTAASLKHSETLQLI